MILSGSYYFFFKRYLFIASIVIISFASITSLKAETDSNNTEKSAVESKEITAKNITRLNPSLYFFPLVDYPFNTRPGSFVTNNNSPVPSMSQSLHLTQNIPQLVHAGIDKTDYSITRRNKISLTGIFALIFSDIFLSVYTNSWLHEEWHRAVMGRRNIGSYDGVYKYSSGSTIPVTNVNDRDLIRLKRDHPDEMVRLSTAGMEAQTEFVFHLQRDVFIHSTPMNREIGQYLLNTIDNIYYLKACASKKADKMTLQMNLSEGSGENIRDFVGLDCNAYVYNLFRPKEPYEARGLHPFGPGIDRYIKYSDGYDPITAMYNQFMYGTTTRNSDLTESERKYLQKQYKLSYINLISPAILGMGRINGRNPFSRNKLQWNFSFAHYITPFGYSIQSRLFLKENDINLIFMFHTYSNASHNTGGIELQLHRKSVIIFQKKIYLGGGIHIWEQPRDLEFWTDEFRKGGMIRANAAIPFSGDVFEYTFEISGKTPGWVAGTVYHNKEIEIQTGINILL